MINFCKKNITVIKKVIEGCLKIVNDNLLFNTINIFIEEKKRANKDIKRWLMIANFFKLKGLKRLFKAESLGLGCPHFNSNLCIYARYGLGATDQIKYPRRKTRRKSREIWSNSNYFVLFIFLEVHLHIQFQAPILH